MVHYLSFGASAGRLGPRLVRRPDIICVYNLVTLALAWRILRWMRGCAVVLDVQDLWPESVAASGMMKNRLLGKSLSWWCRSAYRSPDRITVLSPGKALPSERDFRIPQWRTNTPMIVTITSALPSRVLGNEELARVCGDWSAEKIFEKTGIRERHVAGPTECASDLAHSAAEKLFSSHERAADFLFFCTQTPDYILPTSACLLQHRLGLPTSCAALDFNLGCSGFIYGLSLAQGLMASGQATRGLLLTGDTYTKLIDPSDKSTRTIFGDAGTATLLDASSPHRVHSFVLGTDGRGEKELIVAAGGARQPAGSTSGNGPNPARLYMNGPEVFNFTLKAVPKLVNQVLAKAKLTMPDIDLFVFHQANGYMLEFLRRKIGIPPERFPLHFAHCGNTVSSTIPIVLEHLIAEGRLQPGMKLLLAGFGVGFSWGGCILEWNPLCPNEAGGETVIGDR